MTLFAPFIVLYGSAETGALRPRWLSALALLATLLRNGNVYSGDFDVGVTVW